MGELGTKIEAFWRAFQAKRWDELQREHIASDCRFTMPGMPVLAGSDAIRAMFEAYAAAFPDLRHETLHAIESGETYAAETRYTGTHRGALRGPQGEIAATGKTISWQSADIVRARGGKIVSWHIYHDQIPFLTQLGVLPPPH
jgi:predicted ester cyclase